MPLVLFEERYLRMAQECLESQRPFGVALIREGAEVGGVAEPYGVGTTAEIVHSQPLGDALAVLVVGRKRFRVQQVEVDDGLLRVGADLLPPAPAGAPEVSGLRDEMARAFREHLDVALELLGDPGPPPEVPEEPERLSFMIAAHLTCDLEQRQALLETDDTAQRLLAERDLLSEETRRYRLWLVAMRRADEVQFEPGDRGLLSRN
jgi:hypothetical protein